jgi:predicted dehydrogenase
MSAPLRIGLAGYGFGGKYFHAPLLASAQDCDFLGVVTTSPERRAQVADELGRPAYASLADLARDGAEAVAISTPAATHIPLVREALELGLAVVCDKPFALDAESARETVELAERLGVPLTVYQNRRWDSDFLTLRRLLETDTLGTLIRLESRFERFQPEPGPPAAGGGTLLDFGSHLVDQALVLCGPVERVYAELRRRDGVGEEPGLDEDVFVALTHRGGARSHLSGSWRQGAPGLRFRATGTTGSYVVDGMDGQEDQLVAGASPASEGERWGIEPESRWGQVLRGDRVEPAPSAHGAWDRFYPEFAAAVRGTGPLPVDPWDAVATATVLDAARVSADTGEVVSLA